jgi:hypothetical protein
MEKAKAFLSACQEIAGIFEQVKVEPVTSLSGSVSDNPAAPKKKLLS